MKVTKFLHSCLLVEMPSPVNRTALFDPGYMSEQDLPIEELSFLDDIIITHEHSDHFYAPLVKRLVDKFPEVRITSTPAVVAMLKEEGIAATSESSDGIVFFESPHENVEPLFETPEEIGVHYLDIFSHPGDSHSFRETKDVLALPMTAPWGATTTALRLAFELQPRFILPIHDWHWNDEARQSIYALVDKLCQEKGITFLQLETAKPVVLDV